MAPVKFYKDLEKFCEERNILLIFDEVQTGLGRTGDNVWFSQSLKVSPDIITTAKGIAGGLPLSAVFVKKEIGEQIKVGDHATTFGGGPVPCAAGIAVATIVSKKSFLKDVTKKEMLIRKLLTKSPYIKAIRGKGLLLGIELTTPVENLVEKCLKAGIIIATSSEKNVFRIMPPLTVTMSEIRTFAKIFLRILNAP